MSVYVDGPPFIRYLGREDLTCRIVADSLEELDAMIDRIGADRRRFRANARVQRYDIRLLERALAIQAGAIECNRKTFRRHIDRLCPILEHPTGGGMTMTTDDVLACLRAYGPRWRTARRLAAMRLRDPEWVAGHERLAAIGGFNLQLDELPRAEPGPEPRPPTRAEVSA